MVRLTEHIPTRVLATLVLLWALACQPVFSAEDEYPHGEYEGDCEQCHGGADWLPVQISSEFDHGKGGFPLRGNHRQTACNSCHPSLAFQEAEPACSACHLDPHRGELGTDCGNCHTPRSFIDRTQMSRNHLATRFPLQGAHRAADCEACHRLDSPGLNQFVNLPFECRDCHLAEYLATSDPDHQSNGFPLDCEQCHSARSFIPAGFNHNTLASGQLCQECHLDDYQSTSEPDHELLGFPLDCESCHASTGWEPASFEHDLFPGLVCQDCHLDAYQSTLDPDHQLAGLPLDCDDCHTTNGWFPVSVDGLNHDGLYFPIYSGRHDNRWQSCNECHVSTSNFSNFSCIDCHQHDNEQDLQEIHDEEAPDFEYISTECYRCHPEGRE